MLGLLHGANIVRQRGIGTQLLEQLRIGLVVISIECPLVQRQRCHSTLVTNVKNDLVVGLHTLVQPLHLYRCGLIAQSLQQQVSLGILLLIVLIETGTTRIGKLQGTGIGAVDIREIGRVGIDVSTLERHLGASRGKRKEECGK